jgi:HJR/Mrr/RecB family endonuclease
MARRRRRRSSRKEPAVIPLLLLAGFLFVLYQLPALALATSLVCLSLTVMFWYVGGRRRVHELQRWAAISNMYALSPDDFERHVAETFGHLGYRVTVTRRVGDQGIDVLAERGNECIGIQCKRSTEPASNGAIQEAYAGIAHYRCTKAAVVSLGGFTSSARALATSTNVELIGPSQYADMFHRAAGVVPTRSPWNVLPRSTMKNAVICAAIAVAAFAVGVLHGNQTVLH